MPREDEDDVIPEACRLYLSTWRLLRTLQERPKLAKLVKTIKFTGDDVSGLESEIVTTAAGAVATFSALALNSSSFSFDEAFDGYFDSARQVLKRFAARVEEIHIGCSLSAYDVESLATDFSQIRRLECSSLETIGLVEPLLIPTFQLKSFVDRASVHVPHSLALLSASSASLAHLGINFALASTLDYTQFPHLSHLRLVLFADPSESQRRDYSALWRKLSLAPSLQVLQLTEEGSRPDPGFNASLVSRKKKGEELTRVRRIALEFYLPLDRLAYLVNASLVPALQEVVIADMRGLGRKGLNQSMIDGARGICGKESNLSFNDRTGGETDGTSVSHDTLFPDPVLKLTLLIAEAATSDSSKL